ncbi:hypothetical protein R1T40_18275 [Tritonibacter scottomollicae]|uniref:Orc1-like AAA ATPase domain-containing protein n=2 Tax=Tritonibacter scottomollicae TaxID=483013 RepID=A0ABZ0HFV5_TRISK|nr:hypothetical protein R1T40_18275 [Tritonibacter scottomollicae]
MWKDFGFTKNLYDTHPISGNARGERLLVGRDKELKGLKNRITGFKTVTTIEGPNGVGKTSFVMVGGFQLENQSKGMGKSSILLLPEPFQLTLEDSALDFKRKVYAAIASHFIENEKTLRSQLDLQFGLSPLEAWLENPIFLNGSASAAGFSLGGGKAANESSGFDLHGFFALVDRLLKSAFDDEGGILCVVDNLEILNTSQVARQRLEELRDDLFAKHGIKWVVCGARGIVRSVASSQRLQGRLQEPIEITPLSADAIQDLVQTRVREFRLRDDAIPPVGPRSFNHAFHVLNENLRDTLKFCGDFSLWLSDSNQANHDEEILDELFEIWLADQSEAYMAAVNVPPRAWKLFDDICEQGGSISPSDHEEFGFNSSQNMRGQVQKLEQADLVVSELSDTDHRRKTVSVVAKGWLLRHHRSGYVKREE